MLWEIQIDGISHEITRNQSFVCQYGGDKRCMSWADTCPIDVFGVFLHPLTQPAGRGVRHTKATSDRTAFEICHYCFEKLRRYIRLSSKQQCDTSANTT